MPDPSNGNEPRSAWEALFGDADVVFVYSRAQALEDGTLVDVSEMAKEAGFKFPVAVTAALWANIEAIPEDQSHQDVKGRLWDVLWMGRMAIERSKEADGDTLFYKLIMHTADAVQYTVKMVIGPGDDGEPVITLMLPDED